MPNVSSPARHALGLLEAGSLASGLAALDRSTKEAAVEAPWTRVIEPGRFLFVLTGEVDAVRAALRAGRAALGAALEGELFLAHPHPAVLAALPDPARPGPVGRPPALGVIECRTVAGGLLAADAAAKEAAVEVLRLKLEGGMGGKALVVVGGDTADVESAVAAGAEAAEAARALVRTVQIDAPAAPALAALEALR